MDEATVTEVLVERDGSAWRPRACATKAVGTAVLMSPNTSSGGTAAVSRCLCLGEWRLRRGRTPRTVKGTAEEWPGTASFTWFSQRFESECSFNN